MMIVFSLLVLTVAGRWLSQDYHTWSLRSWCRTELVSHMLSSTATPVVVIKTGHAADIMGTFDSMFRCMAIGRGNLTVDKDRQFLSALVQQVLGRKLELLRNDVFSFRYLMAMRTRFLDGFDESLITMKPETTVAEFLEAYQFSTTDEGAEDGWTPLRFAVIASNVEVATLLVEAGASVSSVLTAPASTIGGLSKLPGNSLLHDAAECARPAEMLALLLKHGGEELKAQLEGTDGMGQTPLHKAAKMGNLDAMDFLIAEGAALSPCDGYQNTPLLLASVFSPVPEAVIRMIDAGAPKDQLNMFGACGLHKTAMHGNYVSMEVLLRYLPEWKDHPKVAQNGFGHYLGLTHELMWHLGQRSWAVTLFGQNPSGTPLHDAARMGYTACIQLLLEAGADLNAKGRSGWTPVQLALDNGHFEIVKLMQIFAGDVDGSGQPLPVKPIEETCKKEWPTTLAAFRECFANDLPLPLQDKVLSDLGASCGVDPARDSAEQFEAILAKISLSYTST